MSENAIMELLKITRPDLRIENGSGVNHFSGIVSEISERLGNAFKEGGFIYPTPEVIAAAANSEINVKRVDFEIYKEKKLFDIGLMAQRQKALSDVDGLRIRNELELFETLSKLEINKEYLKGALRKIGMTNELEIDTMATRGAFQIRNIEQQEGFDKKILYRCGHEYTIKPHEVIPTCNYSGCHAYVCPVCKPSYCEVHSGGRLGKILGEFFG